MLWWELKEAWGMLKWRLGIPIKCKCGHWQWKDRQCQECYWMVAPYQPWDED